MSLGVILAVGCSGVLILVLAVCLCRRLRKKSSRARYLPFSELDHDHVQDKLVSLTSPDPKNNSFTTYRNAQHGFTLAYPSHWILHESPASQGSLIAHFSCPEGEPAFKRLSVAWDDLCWTSITPAEFTHHVVRHLPSAVQGSQIVSQRPVSLGPLSAHELVYTIADEDGEVIKLLNVATIAASKAFTLTFSITESEYAYYLPLARHLISTFRLRDAAAGRAEPETPTDPADVHWSTTPSAALQVTVQHPASWAEEQVGAQNVLRFTCRPGERSFKSVNYFIIDLASVDSDDLLSDLVQFYKEEVERQGTVSVVDRAVVRGLDGGKAHAFRSVGKRGLIDITSVAYVGLHSPTWGHIVTFSAGSDVFDAYAPLAEHLYRSIEFQER